MTPADAMARAVALARRGEGHTRPNPPVGAVIVKAGRILGEGHHRRAGGRHAETAALQNARAHGADVRGATVYVTLEPCSRPGRVGACTDALIAAGVKKVVWACTDPNPVNRGRAARVLRRAGIETAVLPHPGATALLRPFAKHVTTGLPFVTVKLALSLDGKICDDAGNARWISSPASRRTTGLLRSRVDAVMVGAETVRRDDPSLLSRVRRNDDLFRVVVTRSGRLPSAAQVFTDAARDRTLVYRASAPSAPYRDLTAVLRDLGRRGFLHVLCEGGLSLARALAAEGLVDDWLTVLSPVVIGAAPLADALRFPSPDRFIVCSRD